MCRKSRKEYNLLFNLLDCKEQNKSSALVTLKVKIGDNWELSSNWELLPMMLELRIWDVIFLVVDNGRCCGSIFITLEVKSVTTRSCLTTGSCCPCRPGYSVRNTSLSPGWFISPLRACISAHLSSEMGWSSKAIRGGATTSWWFTMMVQEASNSS